MKIMKHPWLANVFIGVTQATILQSLSEDAEPLTYTKADGTEKQYHWLSVGIKDNNGDVKHGSAMLPQKLFKTNPKGYGSDTKLEVALQLNGDHAGRANVHLNDGKFEVSNFVTDDMAKKFNISLDFASSSNATTEAVKETT